MIFAMGEHEEAVRVTAKRVRRAEAVLKDAKAEHLHAALSALRGGITPTAVASLSVFSDAYLRQQARLDGIPAAVKRKRSPGT